MSGVHCRSSSSDYKHVIWVQNNDGCSYYATVVKNFDFETLIAFALPVKKRVGKY